MSNKLFYIGAFNPNDASTEQGNPEQITSARSSLIEMANELMDQMPYGETDMSCWNGWELYLEEYDPTKDSSDLEYISITMKGSTREEILEHLRESDLSYNTLAP